MTVDPRLHQRLERLLFDRHDLPVKPANWLLDFLRFPFALIRDLLTSDFQAIRVDNPVDHQRVLETVERILPGLAPRVSLYDRPSPIFEEYGVQAELDKALRSKVWLKSGGYIVINHTDRKSTRLNSSHMSESRMPSSA